MEANHTSCDNFWGYLLDKAIFYAFMGYVDDNVPNLDPDPCPEGASCDNPSDGRERGGLRMVATLETLGRPRSHDMS